MENNRKFEMVMDEAVQKIEDCGKSTQLRLDEKAFNRQRKLGAKNILRIILWRIYQSLQLCLGKYFDEIGGMTANKQAFSKARKNLNPEYVRSFVDGTSKIAAADKDKPTYNGMPLIAIDGSDVALENTAELKEAFGCSGSKKDAATAGISIAFDPLSNSIYDCRIDRYDTDERTLAKAHVIRLSELGMHGSVLLFDP